jgi:RecB family endonuclease NucS
MVNEARIRDLIAEHLDFIKSGLTLIEKEFRLPNLRGAAGSIDILARDRFGHLVIIEIKKSNKSAREAIHELFKYVSLIKINHKLSNDRIRCLLISTEWYELLIPFSEFAREVEYHVEGYSVILDD